MKKDNDASSAAAALLLVALGLPMLMTIGFFWSGYVLSVVWGWFAVPLFHLPPLSIPAAIGVSLVIGFLTNHRTGNEAKNDDVQWYTLLGYSLARGLFVLGIGYVVKGLM